MSLRTLNYKLQPHRVGAVDRQMYTANHGIQRDCEV